MQNIRLLLLTIVSLLYSATTARLFSVENHSNDETLLSEDIHTDRLLAEDDVLMRIIMAGNSYTYQQDMNLKLQQMLDVDYGSTEVVRQPFRSGGKRIYQHANSYANGAYNALLAKDNNKFFVLQDQSQLPSLQQLQPYYGMSRDAVAYFREQLDEDIDLILMMTWGREKQDQNSGFNMCFTQMQENLKNGYEDYRDHAIEQNPNKPNVYIAPVGLAFQAIHDNYCDGGVSTPQCTGQNSGVSLGCEAATNGNTDFTKLYKNDGSHPTLHGTYLAACVLYATMTGKSPVGMPDPPGNISHEDVVYYQEVAAQLVLIDTPDYDYPWRTDPTDSPTEYPTSNPTETPTESPTESPTQSPTEAPTSEPPTQSPTDTPLPFCTDSTTWHKKGKQNQHCAWAQQKTKQRNKRCAKKNPDGQTANDACPLACQKTDACTVPKCRRNNTWLPDALVPNVFTGCGDLHGMKRSAWKKHCRTMGTVQETGVQIFAYEACAKCGYCDKE